MSKTVPLSVRITEEDASFIAAIKLPGAVTPSEKVRVLISQARQRHLSTTNLAEATAFLRGMLEPQKERIRGLEAEVGISSELVSKVGERLPEIFANFLTAPLSNEGGPTQNLSELERGLAAKVVSLIESVLRLAVTRRNPCYEPDAISSRLDGVLELVELIRQGK
jgi:hypothetical protein